MSREIKFRYYSAPQNKMVGWSDIMKLHVHTVFKMLQPECELMQYTGLKDKNGVDIYEGDIVKSYFYGDSFNDVAQVKYDDSSAAFTYDSSEQDAFVYGAENGQLEVIGNIYENPELLKANK